MSSQSVGGIHYDLSLNKGKFDGDVSTVDSKITALGSKFRSLAKVVAVAGVASLAAFGAKAVSATAQYESSLSQLRQASGATNKEMGRMSELARQLGRDNTLAGVTASDAAATMLELSKAGLSVNDTMAASKGVMSLAKAGQIGFSEAAVIAASALNAFGLKGKDATKVADALAAGANASQANLLDLAEGMQQSATVAKQFKLTLDENVTALALFANNGIRGSDAGTSLKTMLIALAKPSTAASEAMEEIGFSAHNAKGEFVGLREMSKRLKNATKDLTDKQKQQALATIFGTDAFRAAAVLSDNAGKSYDNMSKAVNKSGAAAKAAAAQMGPFQKSVENLQNQASELGLRVGSAVLPILTRLTNAVGNGLVPAFENALQTLQDLAPFLLGATTGWITYQIAVSAATTKTILFTLAQRALNAVMLMNPYAAMAAALVGIATVFATVIFQTDRTKSATEKLNQARREAKTATDAARVAEETYRGALLNQQGATLAVERAQKNYNEAVRQFGPRSLEAREAEHALKRATDDKARADREAKAALEKRDRAQAESNAKVAFVRKAEREKKAEVDSVTRSLNSQIDRLGVMGNQLRNLNGRTFRYTVEENMRIINDGVSSPAAKRAARQRIGRNAEGTDYWRGGLTWVGEKGPELVNLPRGSQVIPNDKSKAMAASSHSVTFNAPIYIRDKSDADYLLGQLMRDDEVASKGMTPRRAIYGGAG